jgi:hypothetical protein
MGEDTVLPIWAAVGGCVIQPTHPLFGFFDKLFCWGIPLLSFLLQWAFSFSFVPAFRLLL